MIKKERIENICIKHIYKYLYKHLLTKYDRNTQVSYNPHFCSASVHVTCTCIYNCLPLLPILYFHHPQKAPQQVLTIPGGATYTFIPGRSKHFIIPPGLGCCSFPLTVIPGHVGTKGLPKESPAL